MQPIQTQLESLIFRGKETTFELLTGISVPSREPSGADESILSNLEKVEDGSNVIEYIASVSGLPVHEIEEWPINDIYYYLLKHRMFVYGETLEFEEYCNNPKCSCHVSNTKTPTKYSQDLREYLPYDVEGVDHAVTRAKIYPHRGELVITTQSTPDLPAIRFRILTSKLERTNTKTIKTTDVNTIILEHATEIMMNDTFIPLTILSALSSRQTAAIRKLINDADPKFNPLVEYVCPECKNFQVKSLVSIPVFYYPSQI